MNTTESLLDSAIRRGDKAEVKLLLEKYDDINAKNIFGETALMNAIHFGHNDIIELLIDKGADVHMSNANGENAFDISIKENNSTSAIFLKPNIIDLQDEDGKTLLMKFCQDAKNALFLIEHGANLNIQDNNGKTSLVYAIFFDVKEVIVGLLKNGADVDIQDNNGYTVLMRACEDKNEKIVLFLEKNGADFFFENNEGNSAYAILKRKRSLPEGLELLRINLEDDFGAHYSNKS